METLAKDKNSGGDNRLQKTNNWRPEQKTGSQRDHNVASPSINHSNQKNA